MNSFIDETKIFPALTASLLSQVVRYPPAALTIGMIG